jgi:hypothetical protein
MNSIGNILFSTLVLGIIINPAFISAQSTADAAVQVSASVQASPPQIILSWPTNSTTSQYLIYRKSKTSTSWNAPIATLSGTATQFIDNTIQKGFNYEYRIIRSGNSYTGYGYVLSGIEVPETYWRGKLILLVDSTFIIPLASEINRLIKDLQGEGWDVLRHDVLRNGSVTHIKSIIIADYAADSLHETRAVYIVGHVPVPYSGNINPDGHPDHLGAWPADVYYGDVNGMWTDNGVSSTTVSPPRTQNIPGDGKFDQSIVPGDVELIVGRADFSNLPAFSATEQQLLKAYLDKNHAYRTKQFSAQKRALIDDNFGFFGTEAFAASGYKNFAPLVGTSSVVAADYITSMASGSYLWAYGCGGGSYVSASGIGSTFNFTNTALQGVFSMLFGSYFGDWDCTNSFLRAPLAQGQILTNCWSGRPHYQFHYMGMGDIIGSGLLLTQNNPGGLYFASPTNITGKWIHNALMGDPTLKQDIMAPVNQVTALISGQQATISWSASQEPGLLGYQIYMRNDSQTVFQKINSQPVISNSFTLSCLLYKGIYEFMVRPLKLETTASGSYYNLGMGARDTAICTKQLKALAQFTTALISNTLQAGITDVFAGALYSWDFNNGFLTAGPTASVAYTNNGIYNVQLKAIHPCLQDSSNQFVQIIEAQIDPLSGNTTRFKQNPTNSVFEILNLPAGATEIKVYNAAGQVIHAYKGPFTNTFCASLDMSGIYSIQICSRTKTTWLPLLIHIN